MLYRSAVYVMSIALLQFSGLTASTAADQITFVVPFAAGGPVDVVPRVVAAKMADSMGVNIVVENRAGAGGNVGAEYVARSQPDGRTLLAFAGGVLTVNPALLSATRFSSKDFAPITNFASTPNVFVVRPNLEASDFKGMIDLARAKPKHLTYSSPGIGTSPHLCVEMLGVREKLDLVHVPFKGGAQAITEIIAKRIDMACSNMLPALPFIRDGRLRALAVTSATRHPLLPDVPTVMEAGLAGFEMLGWYGLAAPAKTSKTLIDKLNVEAVKALRDPGVVKRLQDFGLTPIGDSPTAFSSFIEKESDRWSEIVRKGNLRDR